MEQDEVTLEDGEIVDGVDEYVPLERPPNYSSVQPNPRLPRNIPQSESEEEIQTSDTDSDSDSNIKINKSKKPKIKLRSNLQRQNLKSRKYDIWSTRAQEEALAETLNNCDVTSKDRSRNVETYDYSLSYKYRNNEPHKPFSDRSHRHGNKRNREDRHNANFKQRRRSTSSERVKGAKRAITNLIVDVNNTEQEIAKDIGNKLFEEREDLILKVVNTMGKKRTIEIFNETKKLEEEGGLLILNQTRRRTPGGVFLYLVRNDYNITPEQKNHIFGEDKKRHKEEMKLKQREKSAHIKKEIAASKNKFLPELLTRTELLASQNPSRKSKDSDESDFVNPPPTPEADMQENSNDGMDSVSPIINGSSVTLENARDKLTAYEEDFLDIGCSADMDMF